MTLEFNEDHTPLAYLITFRCYGTWLHGNEKGSVDRHRNRYGSPFIRSDPRWRRHNLNSLKEDPVRLTKGQRATVTTAIKDTCELRKWTLYTVNTRTNHCHVVVKLTRLLRRQVAVLYRSRIYPLAYRKRFCTGSY